MHQQLEKYKPSLAQLPSWLKLRAAVLPTFDQLAAIPAASEVARLSIGARLPPGHEIPSLPVGTRQMYVLYPESLSGPIKMFIQTMELRAEQIIQYRAGEACEAIERVKDLKSGYVLLFVHHFDMSQNKPDMKPSGSVLSAAFKLQALRTGMLPMAEDEPYSAADLEWNRVHTKLDSLHLWAVSVVLRYAVCCVVKVCGR